MFGGIRNNYSIIAIHKTKKLPKDIEYKNSFVPKKVEELESRVDKIVEELEEIKQESWGMLT